MVKTIRVSEEYHEWLSAHKEADETMEETLRRLTRDPHPSDVAGLLTEHEAGYGKEAVNRLRGGDRDRLDAARSAFETEDVGGMIIDSSYLFDLMAADPDAFSKGTELTENGEMQ